MKMIKITPNKNGGHNNQIYYGKLPEGWAIIPDDLKCPGFPIGNVKTQKIQEMETVIEWTPIKRKKEIITISPKELREKAYNTEKVISWENEMITVTEAAQKWQYYAAEGSEKAQELTNLICIAKEAIRLKYPDENSIPNNEELISNEN